MSLGRSVTRRAGWTLDASELGSVVRRFALIVLLLSQWLVGIGGYTKLPLHVLAVIGLLVPLLTGYRMLWFSLACGVGINTVFTWGQVGYLVSLAYCAFAVFLGISLPAAPTRPSAHSPGGRLGSTTIRRALDGVYRGIAAMDVVDVTTRLTLILISLSDWVVGPDWSFKTFLRTLAVMGLVLPPLHRSRLLWWGVAVCMCVKTVHNWWVQDNHLFLLTYWCLTLALAISLPFPRRAIAINAKYLIGFSFACAALWKGILSPDFMDGTYFQYALLTDPRFEDVGLLLGGMTESDYHSNHQALAQLASPTATIETVDLQGTSRLEFVAKLITWWTVAIESLLAIAFLCPRGHKLARSRHAFLLLFAWTTYLVATVETFGWTLMVLGLAQCEPRYRRTRVLYVLSSCLVLAYKYVPVLGLARQVVGS